MRFALILSLLTVPLFADNVQTLRGKAAVDHLEAIKARRGKHFAQAAAVLEARGYKPTNDVVVHRVTRRDGVAPAQTTAADARGEVIFWSWDDGDDSTWEGEIYMENYETGAALLIDGQTDLQDAEWIPVWEQEIYSTGGGGRDPGVQLTSLTPKPVQIASLSLDGGIELAQTRPKLRNFSSCIRHRCMAVAEQCLWSGPYMPQCIIGGCTMVIISCALETLTW